MIRRIVDWWHKRQRTFDLRVLWPACKENAENIEQARAAFAVHAFNDAAWTSLGDDEVKRRIEGLT